MKFYLANKEKFKHGEILLEDGTLKEFFKEIHTYSTVDGFVLKTEVKVDKEILDFSVMLLADDEQVFNHDDLVSFCEKYGSKNHKEIEDLEENFVTLFSPDVSYTSYKLDLSLVEFMDLRSALIGVDNADGYLNVELPGSVKNIVDEKYLQHKQNLMKNSSYNINLSCAFAKHRLKSFTEQSANALKATFAPSVPAVVAEASKEAKTPKVMTVRFIFNKG